MIQRIVIALSLLFPASVYASTACTLLVYEQDCSLPTSAVEHSEILPEDCEVLAGHNAHFLRLTGVPAGGALLSLAVSSADFDPFLFYYAGSIVGVAPFAITPESDNEILAELNGSGSWVVVISTEETYGQGAYTLQSSCSPGPVFVNGFESGDLTAWN